MLGTSGGSSAGAIGSSSGSTSGASAGASSGSSSGAPPVITSFSAAPAHVAPGGASTLLWRITGPAVVTIGGVAASGNTLDITPAASTAYTLTATNSAGSTSATLQVTVAPAADSAPIFVDDYASGWADASYNMTVDPHATLIIAYCR